MIRYKLSRLFTGYAERFVPGDSFLRASASELMQSNRNHYRDNLIESLQALYTKFDSAVVLESKNTGIGKAIIKLSSPQKYPGYYPAEFELSTESSDLLMATGRLAAFVIKHEDGREKLFYYGDSIKPDNYAQLIGTPPYITDLDAIARYLHRAAFEDLYARYQEQNQKSEEIPPVIQHIDRLAP